MSGLTDKSGPFPNRNQPSRRSTPTGNDSNFEIKNGKPGITFYSGYKWVHPVRE